MSEPVSPRKPAREAVQPSLWDRLVNDLPGLSSEIGHLRRALEREIGAERLEALLLGGAKAVEIDADLSRDQKAELHHLIEQEHRRERLEDRGIVVSSRVLREAVRRDIEMLFNTERYEVEPLLTPTEMQEAPERPLDLGPFPEIRRSVVNYGVPSFAGRSARDFDRDALARELTGILAQFEPRLKRETIKVRVSRDSKAGLMIEIDALLIMSPAPERLRLRTMIDLDNGRALTDLEAA